MTVFGLFWRTVCVVATVLLASALPAAAQAPVLTLDEVIRTALAYNRDLKLATQEVEKAALQIDVAKANRFPRLNVSYLEPALLTPLDLRLGPLGALDLPHNFGFAIGSAAQPLTQLHDIGLGIKVAELSRDVAAERVRAARQTVVNEVTRAYYGLLRAESGLKPSREAVGLFKELERLLDTLVEERAALESDRLDVQVRRAQQEHDVVVLEDALATGRERLNVALARDPETPFAFEAIPTDIPGEVDLAAARARVLDQRPDVRQARITVELARTDAKLKKAENRPKVNALFTYIGNINMPLLPGNIAAALVQASWEPFDWGRKAKEQIAKQIAVTQAETALRQLEATIVVDLNARYRALREARSLVAVTELGDRAAREKLRVMLDRHNEGTVLTKDLLQAQVGLSDAGHKYQAALLAYWEARADFEKAVAEDR
jgi:outer membrane protein TolC